mgnify:CR=1 FL=1
MKSEYICPTYEEHVEALAFLKRWDIIKEIEYDVDGNYSIIRTEELPI